MKIKEGFNFTEFKRKNRLAGKATELSPEIASSLGAILGNYMGGEEAVVVTARDYRRDTRMVSRAFNSGLISTGTTVFELHACSLPVLQFALRRFGAHAAVHFAAAHRSPEKINIRIFDQMGVEHAFDDIFSHKRTNEFEIQRASADNIADILSVNQANDIYRSAVKSALNLEGLRERNFSVVIDCALGPVAEIFPNLLAGLGCKVLTLNAFKPEGIPESLPSPTSLTILSRTVLAAKADLGICFSPSGSRVLFFDENGYIIDPHTVITILLKNKMVGREKAHIVLSKTLWTLEEWLKKQNITVHYSDESPGDMSRAIQFNRGIFGANEQGNYIHPTFSNESEPFITALSLLSIFAQNKECKYISTFIEAHDYFNKLYLTEENYTLNVNPEVFFRSLYEMDTENKIVNTLNGVKLIFEPRAWVHVFSTIVASKIVIRACAEDQEERKRMLEEVIKTIEEIETSFATE